MNDYKITNFNEEEYRKILNITELFCEKGASENPPKFVILTGGVGSGKTTIRRKDYGKGYVNFDFGEILSACTEAFGKGESRLESVIKLTCDMILGQSIDQKKNIVIEIMGAHEDEFMPVVNGMTKLGYDTSFVFIDCPPAEAYTRHLKAVEEDQGYWSSYFTQEGTLSFFYEHLGLGELPDSLRVN